MSDANRIIRETVKKAQAILAQNVKLGGLDDQATLNGLRGILDDRELRRALAEAENAEAPH